MAQLNEDNLPHIEISTESGFVLFNTESFSSKVFTRDGRIFKLNDRCSVKRAKSDLDILKSKLEGYEDRLPESQVGTAIYGGRLYTCVSQPMICGREVKKLDDDQLTEVLRFNKGFLIKLLDFFFASIDARELYPDIVGCPNGHDHYNSVNLILDESTNKLLLCDVGLSPHEDTLIKNGLDFYSSENVKVYVEKMTKLYNLLNSL